jgi:hypothetical protein
MRVVSTHEKDIAVRKPVAQFELESATYLVISFCKPIWIQVVLNISDADIATKEILTTLIRDGSAVPHFSWKQGLLRYPTTIYMGVDPELQNRLFIACLSSVIWAVNQFLAVFQWRLCMDTRTKTMRAGLTVKSIELIKWPTSWHLISCCWSSVVPVPERVLQPTPGLSVE